MPELDPLLSIKPSEIPEKFPTLLAATDVPTLKIAVASAVHMQEAAGAPCPITDNMVGHTAQLLVQAERDARHPETSIGLGLRPVYQHMRRQVITRNRTLALVNFAGHQVAHSEEGSVSLYAIEDLFYDAMNVSKGVARPAIKGYCTDLASKDDRDLTVNERRAILAGEDIMRFGSLHPFHARKIAKGKRLRAIIKGFPAN